MSRDKPDGLTTRDTQIERIAAALVKAMTQTTIAETDRPDLWRATARGLYDAGLRVEPDAGATSQGESMRSASLRARIEYAITIAAWGYDFARPDAKKIAADFIRVIDGYVNWPALASDTGGSSTAGDYHAG